MQNIYNIDKNNAKKLSTIYGSRQTNEAGRNQRAQSPQRKTIENRKILLAFSRPATIINKNKAFYAPKAT
jgi:hypothetical protein